MLCSTLTNGCNALNVGIANDINYFETLFCFGRTVLLDERFAPILRNPSLRNPHAHSHYADLSYIVVECQIVCYIELSSLFYCNPTIDDIC